MAFEHDGFRERLESVHHALVLLESNRYTK